MGDKKKSDNIVKQVFDREGPSKERISGLFTHFKFPGRVLSQKQPELAQLLLDSYHGIEFGSSGVKWVHLARTSRGDIQLINMDEQKYDTLSLNARLEQERHALRKILSRHGDKGRFVLSLSGKEAVYLNLAFPRMNDEELKEAIRLKINQVKPFNLDATALTFSWIPWDVTLDAAGKPTGFKLLVFCVPQQIVGERLALLKECGMFPHSIEIAPISLLNLKGKEVFGESRSDEVAIWLDIGADESTMCVEKGGSVCFVRNLSVTGNQMTRQIAQFCQTEESRAEDLKLEYGILFEENQASLKINPPEDAPSKEVKSAYQDMAKKIRQSLVSLLENLVIDIEHSYKHFSYQISQSTFPNFNRIYLTGGSAGLKGLDLYLSERLGVKVETVNPFTGMKVSEDVLSSHAREIKSPWVFGAACALALSGTSSRIQQRNLIMKPEKKTANDLFLAAKAKPKITAAILLTLLAVVISPQIIRVKIAEIQTQQVRDKLKEARKEVGKFQFDKLKAAEIEKQMMDKKANLEARKELLGDSLQGKKKLSKSLNKLAMILPKGIWIKTLSYSQKSLELKGAAPDTVSILNFIDELKKSDDLFLNPVFEYAQKDKLPEFDFKVKVQLVTHDA